MKSLTIWTSMGLSIWIGTLPLTAIAVEFRPPRRGIPGRREGAGTRGPACVQGTPNLTMLLPQTNLGLTTAEYPQFFWFVPKTRAKAMKFTLFRGDELNPEQQLIYEKTLATSDQPGIVSLTVPKNPTIPPLVMGQDYFWSITLLCNPDEPSQNINVEGWVQRVPVNATLTRQLSQAKPSDRPRLYAQNGLWFDTVTSLVALQCAQANHPALTKSWTQLLASVNLERLATQPLQQVCGN